MTTELPDSSPDSLSKNYETGDEYGRIEKVLKLQLAEYTLALKPR